MAELSKPLPGEMLKISTDRFTEPYWEATRERKLVVAQCTNCQTVRHPPGPFCPNCQYQDVDWIEPSGKGEIYSYTVATRSPYTGKVPDFTFIPAVVTLDDQPTVRMIANIVDADPADVAIGKKVTLDWNPMPDGRAVPTFRLA
jgi:uncharacterized OB-fold protein